MSDNKILNIYTSELLGTHDTPQGTYRAVTDGWAVGFAFEQKGQPTQYIMLNPSGDSDDGQACVFVYEGENDTIDNLTPAHFYNIGKKVAA